MDPHPCGWTLSPSEALKALPPNACVLLSAHGTLTFVVKVERTGHCNHSLRTSGIRPWPFLERNAKAGSKTWNGKLPLVLLLLQVG